MAGSCLVTSTVCSRFKVSAHQVNAVSRFVLAEEANNPESRVSACRFRRKFSGGTTIVPPRLLCDDRVRDCGPRRVRGTARGAHGAGAASRRARSFYPPAHSRLTSRARARHRAPMTRMVGLPARDEEIGQATTPPQAKSRPHGAGGRKRAAPTHDPLDETHADPHAVDAAVAPTPTPITPTPTKKRRNTKPFRIEIGPPKEGEERDEVNKPNGRYNKNGVCFHKASGKWRAIVYVGKRQVSLGYFTTQDDAERTIDNARTHGLPKGFTGLRAMQQPKQSEHAGVNWDKHTKKWLARVYEPSRNGAKGKEHKVGYFREELQAVRAMIEEKRRSSAAAPEGEEEGKEGFVARGPGMIHGDISDMVDMGSPPGPAASVASSAPRRLNDPLPR